MSAASKFIEDIERRAGGRVDDPDSNALTMLFGALGREMGVNPYGPKDDFPVGVVLRHRASEAGQREQEAGEMFARALSAGIPPDFFRGGK